ncbi:MAG: TlpA disulfide reductase family protein [Ferrovibrio sp.]
MTLTRRSLLAGATALPLLAAPALAVDPHFYRPYPTMASKRHPAFDDMLFLDDTGVMHSTRDLRGKVIFLHFWGSWCPPCVKELPQLAQLQARLGNDPGLAFVFLNAYESAAASRQFLERTQAKVNQYDLIGSTADRFSSTLNADGQRRKLHGDYQVSVYPTTLLIDRNGLAIAHYGQSNGNWLGWIPLLQDLLDHSAPFTGDDDNADLGWMTGEWRNDRGHEMKLSGSRTKLAIQWTLPDAAPAACRPQLHYANTREAYLSVELPDRSRCKLTLTAHGKLNGARQMPEGGAAILQIEMRQT